MHFFPIHFSRWFQPVRMSLPKLLTHFYLGGGGDSFLLMVLTIVI